VIEVLSPVKTPQEIVDKFEFYDRYGVEEYYVIDPDRHRVEGYLRGPGSLRPAGDMDGFVSPRLGIRFDLSSGVVRVYHPDGEVFRTHAEMAAELRSHQQGIAYCRRQIEEARQRTERALKEFQESRQRAERLTGMLRARGVDPGA
jgi:hypothetical protein